MSTRLLLLTVFGVLMNFARAYPPAPFHRIYGIVRDEHGTPLAASVGTLILSGTGNQEIVRATSDTAVGPGINYSLSVPMDSGTTALLYSVSALRPTLPFIIRVAIDGVSYVPVQMVSTAWAIGSPALSTRLDLTLGIDSDNDGLPDSWENDLIDGDVTGRLRTIADINPNDDLDGDGLTNRDEYIAGTYPLENGDGLFLKIVEVSNGFARLRFLAISGRTYSITSSTILAAFNPQTFAITPTTMDAGLFYQSDDVRNVDVYVPAEIGTPPVSVTKMFFKLKVQ
jgi:hypothetical protein